MLRFIAPAAVEGPGPLQSLQEFFAEYQPTGTVGSIVIKAGGNTQELAGKRDRRQGSSAKISRSATRTFPTGSII